MDIAVISEGVSDRPIIGAILHSFFTERVEKVIPNINSLLPKKNESVGWTNVLKYCESDEFKGAFDFNEYVIIQIDSDRHSDKGYDIEKQATSELLILAIANKIAERIGKDFYEAHKERIIFCICVDEIECWFLPFHATTKAHKTKQMNCCNTLNLYLRKLGYTIDSKKSDGSHDYYLQASKLLANKKDFFVKYKENSSLKYFIDIELTTKIKVA